MTMHIHYILSCLLSITIGFQINTPLILEDNPSFDGIYPMIRFEQDSRDEKWYQYDATNEYIYFSYNRCNCVDVYDFDGQFCFSISPMDQQNGCVTVRCEDGLTYIGAKDGAVFIFQGEVLIESLSRLEVKSKGFDFYWFYNNSPSITVSHDYISYTDESGQVTKQIKTPDVVSESMPFSNTPNSDLVIRFGAVAILISVAVIFIWFLFRMFQ